MDSRLPPIWSPKVSDGAKRKTSRARRVSILSRVGLIDRNKFSVEAPNLAITQLKSDSKAVPTSPLPPLTVNKDTQPTKCPGKNTRKVSIRKAKNTTTEKATEDQKPKKKTSQIDHINANSEEIQCLVALLDEQVAVVETPQHIPSGCSSMLGGLTPPPQYIVDYGKHMERFPDEQEQQKEKDTAFKPKECWCNRCQIMYRMHMESDGSLGLWGNYPCHQF
ncbi:hypothetical protein CAPTEDRAFT_205329 [Capitella teleta]|uniref:Uncharacterized protein n=1 Tax=Capitella teleta TaxID=283909 RepID=R7TR08_CAPTE|nr:hypothetical protein CAPTEDRAFT_205329 [Capitella teleta]|eukprot:ELT93926.1 hypothetical protein CAPTEDRAFT_205329 [Capitella teleta]